MFSLHSTIGTVADIHKKCNWTLFTWMWTQQLPKLVLSLSIMFLFGDADNRLFISMETVIHLVSEWVLLPSKLPIWPYGIWNLELQRHASGLLNSIYIYTGFDHRVTHIRRIRVEASTTSAAYGLEYAQSLRASYLPFFLDSSSFKCPFSFCRLPLSHCDIDFVRFITVSFIYKLVSVM